MTKTEKFPTIPFRKKIMSETVYTMPYYGEGGKEIEWENWLELPTFSSQSWTCLNAHVEALAHVRFGAEIPNGVVKVLQDKNPAVLSLIQDYNGLPENMRRVNYDRPTEDIKDVDQNQERVIDVLAKTIIKSFNRDDMKDRAWERILPVNKTAENAKRELLMNAVKHRSQMILMDENL